MPLEKARRLEPEKASIREALGIAYFRITDWQSAEREFRKVLELSPVDDYAHYALGRSLLQQGRAAEASTHLKLARFLQPRAAGRARRSATDPLSRRYDSSRSASSVAYRRKRFVATRVNSATYSSAASSSSVRAYDSRMSSSRSAIASTTSW